MPLNIRSQIHTIGMEGRPLFVCDCTEIFPLNRGSHGINTSMLSHLYIYVSIFTHPHKPILSLAVSGRQGVAGWMNVVGGG